MDSWRTRRTTAADYKVNKAVPLLFGLMAVSVLATVMILVAAAAGAGRAAAAAARACSDSCSISCSSARDTF